MTPRTVRTATLVLPSLALALGGAACFGSSSGSPAAQPNVDASPEGYDATMLDAGADTMKSSPTEAGPPEGGDACVASGVFGMTKASYPVGRYPFWVAASDLNGDGRLDLAVSNFGPVAADGGGGGTTISILLNAGGGTFAPQVTYTVGIEPAGLAVADLNGDGKPDLAVPNQLSNDVSILLNAGDGTFGTQATYMTGSEPAQVVVADFDGDGKPDLAVTNFGGTTVSILLNTGGGTFGAPMNFAAGSAPWPIAVGDLNGDGKPDLAVGSHSAASVLLNTGSEAGAPAFAPQVSYPAYLPSTLLVTDLNGDGKIDLAVANGYVSPTDEIAGDLSVLLNTGSGAFVEAGTYPVGPSSQSMVAADFNGDGQLDLAVSSYGVSNIAILLHQDGGTYAPQVDYTTFGNPNGMVAVDVDGNGTPDIVYANAATNNVDVLLNPCR